MSIQPPVFPNVQNPQAALIEAAMHKNKEPYKNKTRKEEYKNQKDKFCTFFQAGQNPQCCGQKNGHACTMNHKAGQCYAGYCKTNVNCIGDVQQGWWCQTMNCYDGYTGDVCARDIGDGVAVGYCNKDNKCVIYV